MKIGDQIYDMHGQNFKSERLLARFSIRNPAEWVDEEMAKHYHMMICGVVRAHSDRYYMNKYLVVVGRSLHDPDWMVAMYSYDSRRCGLCLVRA